MAQAIYDDGSDYVVISKAADYDDGLEGSVAQDVVKSTAPPTTIVEKRKEHISVPVVFTYVGWDDLRRQKCNPVGGASITDSWLYQVRREGTDKCRIGRPANWDDVTIDWEFDSIPIMVGNQKKNHGEMKSVTLTHFLKNLNHYTNLTVEGEFVLARDTHLAVSPQTNLMEAFHAEKVQFVPVMHHHQWNHDQPSQLVIVASAGGTSVFLCDVRTKELPFNENGGAYNYSAETLTGYREQMRGSGVTEESGEMNAFELYKNTLFVIMFELETTRDEVYWNIPPIGLCDEGPVMRGIFNESDTVYRSVSHAKYETAIVGKGDHLGPFFDSEVTIKRLPKSAGRVMIERFKIGGKFGADTWTTTMQKEMQDWSDTIFNSGRKCGSLIFDFDDRVTQVTLTEDEQIDALARAQITKEATAGAAVKAQKLLCGGGVCASVDESID